MTNCRRTSDVHYKNYFVEHENRKRLAHLGIQLENLQSRARCNLNPPIISRNIFGILTSIFIYLRALLKVYTGQRTDVVRHKILLFET